MAEVGTLFNDSLEHLTAEPSNVSSMPSYASIFLANGSELMKLDVETHFNQLVTNYAKSSMPPSELLQIYAIERPDVLLTQADRLATLLDEKVGNRTALRSALSATFMRTKDDYKNIEYTRLQDAVRAKLSRPYPSKESEAAKESV